MPAAAANDETVLDLIYTHLSRTMPGSAEALKNARSKRPASRKSSKPGSPATGPIGKKRQRGAADDGDDEAPCSTKASPKGLSPRSPGLRTADASTLALTGLIVEHLGFQFPVAAKAMRDAMGAAVVSKADTERLEAHGMKTLRDIFVDDVAKADNVSGRGGAGGRGGQGGRGGAQAGRGRGNSNVQNRFQRVDASKVAFAHNSLMDNSPQKESMALKQNQLMMKVRGKEFNKHKQKNKSKLYVQNVDFNVKSYKFDSDDE